MDFLTEEELFELQHQDEMDLMNDIEPMDYNDDFDPFTAYGSRSRSQSNKSAVENKSKGDSTLPKEVTSLNLPVDKDISENFNQEKNGHLDNHTDKGIESELLILEEPSCSGVKKKTNGWLDDKSDSEIEGELQIVEEPSCSGVNTNQSCTDKLSQKEKRKVSDLSEDDLVEISAKKPCYSYENEKETLARNESVLQGSTSFSNYPSLSREKLPMTCKDGRRVYFFINEEDDKTNEIQSFSQRTFSLLPVSISALKSQYFILEELMMKEKDAIAVEDTSVDPDVDIIDEEEKNIETSLWVEKYRPVSYTHLLSDEGINRTMLQWLKLWDKVVFGKEKKVKKAKKTGAESTKPAHFKKPMGELILELDEHDRPYHKVAFLCGPPGLGKTTLSTIIARHAGYNVVELNASDDRNPEAFRTNIEAATQMKSVLQEDHRPNCLILDEIDGAPAASINVLMSFIKSVGIPKDKQRKKGDIPLLKRPIICICNDQYAPALKPLRQIALIMNFPSNAVYRLTGRLHEICSQEGLLADMAALVILCEKTANDVRSCLSTLQFIHRKQKALNVSDLKGLKIGQKDMQKSLFAVWQDIFHFKEKKSFLNVFNTVQAFGDYDKVYVGMFENYLNVKFKTCTLDTIWQGSEWSCFGDIIQQQIAEKQLYFLMPYLPYPAVAFHMLFASATYPQLSYPNAFFEHKFKSSQLSSTLGSLVKDMVSSLKTFLDSNILLIDIFPFLIEIMKPNLRPVNTQLYSEREKKELRRVIELMLAFNLNYHQERSLDGTYNYVLDPNIEELIKFSDIKPKKVLTYATKQMIAREVDVELMRKGDASGDQIVKKVVKEGKENVNKPKALEVKPVKKNEPVIIDRPVLDFFGRQIVQPVKSSSEVKKDTKDEEVWFHFKEGYSNAVRKPVYIKDLL